MPSKNGRQGSKHGTASAEFIALSMIDLYNGLIPLSGILDCIQNAARLHQYCINIISRYKMTVNNEAAQKIFKEVFNGIPVDLRSLQSIACHLRMSIDLEKYGLEILKNEMATYFSNNHISLNHYMRDIHHIGKRPKINLANFDFLDEYGVKLVNQKINDFSVFALPLTTDIFNRGQSPKITLCYLSDISSLPIEKILENLNNLRSHLESMKLFIKKIKWFDGSEKINAARDYFQKNLSMYHQILGQDDLEVFFLNNYKSEEAKELIFSKIVSLFNNRKSRGNSQKKQCNFSVDKKTISLIDKLAKSHHLSRSEFLDLMFRSENESKLQELVKGAR